MYGKKLQEKHFTLRIFANETTRTMQQTVNATQQDISLNKQLADFYQLFDQKIEFSYKGAFDPFILSLIGEYILTGFKEQPILSRKLFGVFIELAQNIAAYSADSSNFVTQAGVGALLIADCGDYFKLATGNLIKNTHIGKLREKCEHINTLNRNELREYKRELRRLPQRKKGNANFGLVQVALTSGNPLDFEISPIDQSNSFFSLAVKINKKT